jgi:hypothetical protein
MKLEYKILIIILLILIIYYLFIKKTEKFSVNEIEINKCYPPITIDFLKKYENNDDISEMFKIDRIINPLPDKTKVISCSLFCKNVNVHYDNELPQPDSGIESNWYKKYMISLLNNIDAFGTSELVNNGWKIRIYLANDLANDEYINLLSRPYVEIYIMKSSSIGAQPGTLWRYLVYSDNAIDMAGIIDIDEPFDNIYKLINIFNRYPNHLLIKQYETPVIISPNSDHINNAIIRGGGHIIRPKLFNLNIEHIMTAFIRYRMDVSKSSTPNLYGDEDKENICNKPIDKHIYGWGNHWFMYGFDERFLKHVIFYYIIEKGGMITLHNNNQIENHPAEYNYTMKINSNNIFIKE